MRVVVIGYSGLGYRLAAASLDEAPVATIAAASTQVALDHARRGPVDVFVLALDELGPLAPWLAAELASLQPSARLIGVGANEHEADLDVVLAHPGFGANLRNAVLAQSSATDQ